MQYMGLCEDVMVGRCVPTKRHVCVCVCVCVCKEAQREERGTDMRRKYLPCQSALGFVLSPFCDQA